MPLKDYGEIIQVGNHSPFQAGFLWLGAESLKSCCFFNQLEGGGALWEEDGVFYQLNFNNTFSSSINQKGEATQRRGSMILV